MRIGRRFKKMARKLSDSEATLLWSRRDASTVYHGYAELFRVKRAMKARIDERALYVEEKAKQNGEKARHTWHACHDSCAICGGTQPEHFHFWVEGKKGKKVNLEEWLGEYLSAEEVVGFVSLVRNRENLCVLLHYETILLKNLGLLEDSEK